MTRRAAVGAAALLLASQAGAALYRCPDEGGGSIVTNLLQEAEASERSCELLRPRASLLDAASAPPRRGGPPRRATLATAAPPGAPAHRIAAATQRVRDDERRVILETELRIEQEARARLAQRAPGLPAGGEERRRAEQALARHAANVDALQRELARLR